MPVDTISCNLGWRGRRGDPYVPQTQVIKFYFKQLVHTRAARKARVYTMLKSFSFAHQSGIAQLMRVARQGGWASRSDSKQDKLKERHDG